MWRCGLSTEDYIDDKYSCFKVFFTFVCLFKLQINNKTLMIQYGLTLLQAPHFVNYKYKSHQVGIPSINYVTIKFILLLLINDNMAGITHLVLLSLLAE